MIFSDFIYEIRQDFTIIHFLGDWEGKKVWQWAMESC